MTLHITPLNLPGIGPERPLIIAGPCSAESEEQVMNTAAQLAAKGVRIFRAGIWKPRTKPGGFEGVGAVGLPWLKRVKDELGMLTATEVATPKHVEAALEAGVDILWIGARTMANPFAMQELADSLKGKDVPVLVKNPVNPDLELWIGGLERLNGAGITRLADLEPVCGDLYLWQGDITRLQCGAIVNAANSGMTGCYQPCHACIDNCIHTYSGVQLRNFCQKLYRKKYLYR